MSTAGSQGLAITGSAECRVIYCRECRHWTREDDWEFQGSSGPIGECRSPRVFSAYGKKYDIRGVFLHEEGGYTGTLMTGPLYGCVNGEARQ